MSVRHSFSRRSHKTGLGPGSLIHIGERKTENISIWEMDYNSEGLRNDKEMSQVAACKDVADKSTTTWINITGIHEPAVIEQACSFFQVHPLIQEDILNTGQRPKTEDFEHYLYIVMKVICWDSATDDIVVDQISILLADGYVVTFQEKERGVLDPVRERIRNNKGRIRKLGADYLVYAILDAIIDNYFAVLEQLGDRIETLEEEMVKDTSNRILHEIHRFKRDMINLRKAVWPSREVMGSLHRGESTLFKQETLIYLKDVTDHTIQIIDTVESYRDMVSGLLDFYISNVNNKMNEVMKVLTVISTIFIPITFIASIYGMNFDGMQELHWPGSYYVALGLMGIIGLSLFLYFKRRKWI